MHVSLHCWEVSGILHPLQALHCLTILLFIKEMLVIRRLRVFFKSVFALSATGWIQLGVIVLMLTPVMRVVLSLVDFGIQRDWLYVIITGIVLLVIIVNSLVGVG